MQLSAKEFAVLEYLLRNQGVVLARETIENHVWDYDFEGGSNVVDVYIRYLRKKVDDGFEKKLIQTVRRLCAEGDFMKKLSVKMKITLWYTGLIVIILSAIFTAVLLATDKVLLLGVQNKLEEEVYDFAEELKVDSNGRLRLEKLDFLKDGVRLAVYHENGQMITGLVASGLPETPFADELLQKAGSDQQNWFLYDFYFKPRHADNFYWVRGTVPLSSAYAERDKILRQCALFFPLLILLAALGGYWITKKAFRPVTRITEAAAQISSGSDLSKRIELEGADDEIDTLAKTFDGMFARLEDAFEAERQFTDDASHELRTPTSVIIAQAECGLQSPDLESKQQALQGVLQQAGKMSKLVNQLLQLSRADRHKESLHLEEFDLSELTEMVAEEAQGLAESKAVTLTAEIEPGILVKRVTVKMRSVLFAMMALGSAQPSCQKSGNVFTESIPPAAVVTTAVPV